MTIIETAADLEEGLRFLTNVEPKFARACKETGDLPLRRRPEGFGTLLDAIVSQQLSVASANAIKAKLKSIKAYDSEHLKKLTDEELRSAGLSRQKIRYARALADAQLPYSKFASQTDEEISAQLTAVVGIGKWTADIYLMFALGRADAFASGDLALQESAKLLLGLEARPTPKQFEMISEPWRPWRAVAARLLWNYYHVAKEREGI